MCGIFGLVGWKYKPEDGDLVPCVSELSHRGPDGQGIFSNGPVFLGHRRLSIIDPLLGGQPLISKDGLSVITYNGELYNFKELRKDLEQKGHSFKTNSDTEVVLNAYQQWGDSCVEKFRGMFAFGIADFKNTRLFLARDHLGIKPVVYYQHPDFFAFASEIRSLRRLPLPSLKVDLKAIDDFLHLSYIPAPSSIFTEIKKIPPGKSMAVSFDGHVSTPKNYWSIRFNPDETMNEVDAVSELNQILKNSVKAHLVSDVDFGAFLSGGVDSSTILAYMTQILDRPVKAFSIGFSEKKQDELPYAKAVANHLGCNHYTEIVSPNALEILPDLVKAYGEPFGDSSAVNVFHVSKMAKKYVSMVLSGDGGDEFFGGYHQYWRWLKALQSAETGKSYRPAWNDLIYPVAHWWNPFRYRKRLPGSRSLSFWLSLIGIIPNHARNQIWRPEFRHLLDSPPIPFDALFQQTLSLDTVSAGQFIDVQTYLPFDILTKCDVASMLNGLEVRTPFVDIRVAEFAAKIPSRLKLFQRADGSYESKWLLKKVAEQYIPRSAVYREKRGFGVPLKQWFSFFGKSRNQMKSRLLCKESPLYDYFEPRMIQKIVNGNAYDTIWLFLFLDEWLKQNVSNLKVPSESVKVANL